MFPTAAALVSPGAFTCVLACVLTLAGCATAGIALADYDASSHETPATEWSPHRGVAEWWYVTGRLESDDGHEYLYQYTMFHGHRGIQRGWITDLAVTDYESGEHIFEEYLYAHWHPGVRADDTMIRGPHGGIRVVDKGGAGSDAGADARLPVMTVTGTGQSLSFDVELRAEKPAVWHDVDGIIPMGHTDRSRERSFYYSYTRMSTEGVLVLRDRQIRVTGTSWLDRQWGTFTETGWDWFSFRFDDGEEIMLFAFPETGFTGGTYVKRDGTVEYFSTFEYDVLDHVQYRGRSYGLGWDVRLPVKGRAYRVLPLLTGEFNPNVLSHYWEGLCRVYDGRNTPVGHCVTETTAGARN